MRAGQCLACDGRIKVGGGMGKGDVKLLEKGQN